MDQTTLDTLLAYVQVLSSRMDHNEVQMVEQNKRMESKLDQLVVLMKDVATIQQMHEMHTEELAELRNSLNEQSMKTEAALAKILSRQNELIKSVSTDVENELLKVETRTKTNTDGIKQLDAKLHTWLNRGVGGWAVFVLIVGAFQVLGVRFIEDAERKSAKSEQVVASMKNRIQELETRQSQLEILLTRRNAK